MFKDYEMILYTILGVLFALSVLVAVLEKNISRDILFSFRVCFIWAFACNRNCISVII